MKNIEKYPNTMDALDAYVVYRKDRIGGVSFDIWLEHEYVEPREQTLLEAAEAAVKAWCPEDCDINTDYLNRCLKYLSETVEREKRKPVLNCDVYRTADEAVAAFVAFIRKNKGNEIADTTSLMDWLYAEADKEAK